jgi:hypothetical protein
VTRFWSGGHRWQPSRGGGNSEERSSSGLLDPVHSSCTWHMPRAADRRDGPNGCRVTWFPKGSIERLSVSSADHTKAPEGTGGRTASRLAAAPNKSGVTAFRPGPSLDGLATVEPGSRTVPEDRSPVRSGGSHLPLRAGRTLRPGRPGHNGLIHELRPNLRGLIPDFPTVVDGVWTGM